VCGKRFEWSDKPGAEWLGSLKNMEDHRWERITVVCSAGCKRAADQQVARKKKRF
jgi:hypothetical protein